MSQFLKDMFFREFLRPMVISINTHLALEKEINCIAQ
jgi:hypothetical protein